MDPDGSIIRMAAPVAPEDNFLMSQIPWSGGHKALQRGRPRGSVGNPGISSETPPIGSM